ncbi:xanthine dehydrogenase accessory protein XdhC [Thalassolituus marinus]|uniref:Xanthine dehydrogenase accessory protein XdhC n=1 Tax=Thalassolituus marinus TaxID=671053 RepID=A0ABS7ZT30_9GAMM|nr:xanthine dehydrogenase accessory protein XdhC [Thalassolituus marinus]MCA6064844.1 xanthine dehydrogenase accessory protein XdhC [Thalassolituus marinus]
MKFSRWFDAIQLCEQKGESYVIATVMGSAGSVPRDPGAKMVITADDQFDTVGGGQLEFQLVNKARELLLHNRAQAGMLHRFENMPLAAKAGQCCGGSVTVLLEAFIKVSCPLVVFGAGHVAKALMQILGGLPRQVIWVDNRAEQFPAEDELAANIRCQLLENPVSIIEQLPAGSELLIVTHNHQLDYELLQQALRRDDFAFVGCIGSATKNERFRMRLQHEGYGEDELARLTMPVGLPQVAGKLPMEVAVSIAAQLLSYPSVQDGPATSAADASAANRKGLNWRQIKETLQASADSTEPAPASDAAHE